MLVTVLGMVMEVSIVLPEKAELPMAVMPESRVIVKLLSVMFHGLEFETLTTVPVPFVNRMLLTATHPENEFQ